MFAWVGSVRFGSFIHVDLDGICMIYMICTCLPSVICMICRIYIIFTSWDLYDLDLSYMFAWVGSLRSGSFIHVCLGGICIICTYSRCGICMICMICCTCLAGWDLYDLQDLLFARGWISYTRYTSTSGKHAHKNTGTIRRNCSLYKIGVTFVT